MKYVLVLICCLIFFSRGSTYATPSFRQAARSGTIRYLIEVKSDELTKSELQFDFEVALGLWLEALGRKDVVFAEVEDPKDADIILRYAPESLNEKWHPGWVWKNYGHHYISIREIHPEKNISVIEIPSNRKYRRFSLQKAKENEAKVNVSPHEASKYPLLTEFLGEAREPTEVVRAILRTKPVIHRGESLYVHEEWHLLLLGTLLHEIGHAFGLKDRYDHENGKDLSRWQSLMGNKSMKPLFPTLLDRMTAKRILSATECVDLLSLREAK